MEKIPKNQLYNRLICDLVIAAVEKYPEWRFGQILRNIELIIEMRDEFGRVLGWQDEFNTPTEDILGRIKKYKTILEGLGAYVDNNAIMAIKRLKIEKINNEKNKATRKAKTKKLSEKP
jgi:hypothetical protein